MKDYIHKDLGREIRTISGYFTYLEENRLIFQDRDILYVVGIGIVDNSCCGAGGCRFIEVPGYILFWKDRIDEYGNVVSKVIPVEERADKGKIRNILGKKYPYSQINFG